MKIDSANSVNLDEEPFRLVVESAPNGIIVANSEGQIVMVNRRAEEMFGYERGEFLKLKIESLVPQRFRGGHDKLRGKFHGSPEPRAMGAGRDLYAVRKDGSELPVEIALTPIPRKDGMWILSSIIDITERKQIEAQLSFQAEILRNVHDAVFYVGEVGVIKDWNEGAIRIFSVPAEEAIGRSVDAVCGVKGQSLMSSRILKEVETRGLAEEVIQCRTGLGDKIYVRAKLTRMSDSDSEGYVICASDVTRESMLQEEIVRVSENEQRRIGQDIHDDLCSQLSGIGCLTKVLEQQAEATSEGQAELASKIAEMVAHAGEKAREIAKGLVPTVLETQGLGGAIQVLGERNHEMFGVNCSVKVDGGDRLSELKQEVSVQLYRITQEGVNNAVKHSDADYIEVIVRGVEDRVELVIRDDGRGMPPDIVSSGMGLLTMQRRAEIIGADLEVIAFSGEGTEIQCVLPLIDA